MLRRTILIASVLASLAANASSLPAWKGDSVSLGTHRNEPVRAVLYFDAQDNPVIGLHYKDRDNSERCWESLNLDGKLKSVKTQIIVNGTGYKARQDCINEKEYVVYPSTRSGKQDLFGAMHRARGGNIFIQPSPEMSGSKTFALTSRNFSEVYYQANAKVLEGSHQWHKIK